MEQGLAMDRHSQYTKLTIATHKSSTTDDRADHVGSSFTLPYSAVRAIISNLQVVAQTLIQ
ncbi:predicted protein [Sclerotinia sclerotiorum 1980 UF-70]|uniref:Uncharacterized protein n=1 Tax=Sclerotinia sclerotiorum (strain ATCC 18683 / 1980 / Ss-1) TaxID=665079 RepID=A7EY15_SCLS1|nr:predicted protein [Sclerotinia sclerotiorum 1980 UF-70]EDN94357.1 predicted protein [Sclerotinia sclerotiorum 1980 UF-70]